MGRRRRPPPEPDQQKCGADREPGARQLYLDADGVLADFDAAAEQVLGERPSEYQRRHGVSAFWAAVEKSPDFFARAPLMPDALVLFEAVRHLDPIILTGLPRGDWAAPQKARWAREHFPGTQIITCMAVDKPRYCGGGDVLVDDQPRNERPWQNAGGVFILHKSAEETLRALASYFPDLRPARSGHGQRGERSEDRIVPAR